MLAPFAAGAWKRVALWAVPLTVLLATDAFARVRGPFWLARNQDPDYTYFLSGLTIADGGAPGHVDHPGTPIQVMGAVVVRLVHPLLGEGPDAIEDALAHPEMYLRLLAGLLVVGYAASLYGLGLVVLRATLSLPAALLSQASPLLSTTVLLELDSFKPEPLLLILATLLSLTLAATWDGRIPTRRAVLGAAALAGLAIASKVTAIPLLAIPLVMARSGRMRAEALGTTVASFALATAPAWPQARAFLAFQLGVVQGHGLYGRSLLPEIAVYGQSLRTVLVDAWLFEAMLAASAVTVVLAWRRRRPGPEQAARARGLAALTVAGLGQLGLLLEHPYGARYLVPALALVGPCAALVLLVSAAPLSPSARARWAGAALAAAAAVAVRVGVAVDEQRRFAKEIVRMHLEAWTAAQASGCRVVTYYPASAPEEALRLADLWTHRRFGERLQSLYPSATFYYANNEFMPGPTRFESFTGPLREVDLSRLPCLVFLCAPGGPVTPYSPDRFEPSHLPIGGRLKVLSMTPVEAARVLKPRGQ